jgi:hypothetical protein
MNLLTKEIEKTLTKNPIYSHDGELLDAKVIVKYFNPTGAGTWLITEGEKQSDGTWLLYGYCFLFEWEWGTVSLEELKSFKGRFGLGIERDLWIGKNSKVRDLI